MLKMAVKNTINQILKNYKKKLALDLLYIRALENNEIKRIDSFCYALDDPSDETPADLQILKVKKIVIPQFGNITNNSAVRLLYQEAHSLEISDFLTNNDKILREASQEPESQSDVSLNSHNSSNTNTKEKTVQLFLSAGKAVAIKLSYALLNVLKEPEGIISDRYQEIEQIIDLFTFENVVVGVKLSNVFRKSYTLYLKSFAEHISRAKTELLVDKITVTDMSNAREVVQQLRLWTDHISKENLNILPSQSIRDSSVVFNGEENSTNPVLNISNLSIPLKYFSMNDGNSLESQFSEKWLENVKSESLVPDVEEDCLTVESDDNMEESCDGLDEIDSDNLVESFIKRDPRLLNSIVKLEDIGISHWSKKSLRASPDKKFIKYAISTHDSRVTRLGAHTKFLRSVKRRAIQNLNRTTKKEIKRKYNTRSSNRENRVRFKIEHGTLIIIGRND